MEKERVSNHFESIANQYDSWKEKSYYYYGLLSEIYRELVPEGSSVLEIGCGTGTLLSSLRPRRGRGVDISPKMVEIAASKFPHLTFTVADAESFDLGETFEFVIVPDVIEHLPDVRAMFRSARIHCDPATILIVSSANPLWAPVLKLAERLSLKMPEGEHRWLAGEDIRGAANDTGFDTKSFFGRILCPKRIPLLAPMLNGAVPRIRALQPYCLTQVHVFSPRKECSNIL